MTNNEATQAWTKTTLHKDCGRCESAAGSAIAHARVTGSRGATWTDRALNLDGSLRTEHSATVKRVAA